MYIACLCPNLVSVHFYAIPILHFKFPKFFIYLYSIDTLMIDCIYMQRLYPCIPGSLPNTMVCMDLLSSAPPYPTVSLCSVSNEEEERIKISLHGGGLSMQVWYIPLPIICIGPR